MRIKNIENFVFIVSIVELVTITKITDFSSLQFVHLNKFGRISNTTKINNRSSKITSANSYENKKAAAKLRGFSILITKVQSKNLL